MKILGIETSSSVFSICLGDDDRVILEIRKDRTAAGERDRGIFNEVKRILDILKPQAPGAIAVATGPGMFTALRVGLSIAKGLAIARQVPVVGVNTLDQIGAALACYPGRGIAVINAFRGEVYAAEYRRGGRVTDCQLLTPGALLIAVGGKKRQTPDKSPALIAGPGIAVLTRYENSFRRAGALFSRSDCFAPTAARTVLLALPRIRRSDYDEVDSLEPCYLKKTDAELAACGPRGCR